MGINSTFSVSYLYQTTETKWKKKQDTELEDKFLQGKEMIQQTNNI